MSNLDEALRQFEATEANLSKLEKLWILLSKNIPTGISFVSNAVYENSCRSYENLLAKLPLIDGWRPTSLPIELDNIAQSRFDAAETGDALSKIKIDCKIEKPVKELREYRFKFDQKRKQLVQDKIPQTFNEIEDLLDQLQKLYPIVEDEFEYNKKIEHPLWLDLQDRVKQIDLLLGSSIRPARWNDMQRHLHYSESNDLRDIVCSDWPSVKAGLTKFLDTSKASIHMMVDLSDLVASKPSGSVLTKLRWESISADDFERLVFNLVTSDENHENPQWLMQTNAPDQGRDLSAYRVYKDKLSDTTRKRVIIQCKHWLSKSVSLADVSALKEQVKLWEPPRIDILVIATTGRFTADAIRWIEQHNRSDSAMTIEVWADSHLEKVLALNPAIVAEFCLR